MTLIENVERASQFGSYISTAQVAPGGHGSNAEAMQALMFAIKLARFIAAQDLVLTIYLPATIYMLPQQV